MKARNRSAVAAQKTVVHAVTTSVACTDRPLTASVKPTYYANRGIALGDGVHALMRGARAGEATCVHRSASGGAR